MQASAAGADQAFRLDYLFDTREMLWEGAAIDRAWLGNPVSSGSVPFILSMDGSHGRFQVFQGQIELVGIGLLGFASEGGLLEGCDQLLKSLYPLVLRAMCSSLLAIAKSLDASRTWAAISIAFRAATSSGRSAATNIPGNYQIPSRFAFGICRAESSCRSYSMVSGVLVWTARTRRQSRPANSASNWAWVRVIRPSRMPGQVKVCSSSRL